METVVLLVLVFSQYCAYCAPKEVLREGTGQIKPPKSKGGFPWFCFVLKAALLLHSSV